MVEQEKLTYHVDRSRIVAYRRCPRSRFLGYEVELPETEAGVRGVSPGRLSLPILIGSSVHLGLESLHAWYMGSNLAAPADLDFALERALEYFNSKISEEEMELSEATEQAAIDEFSFLNKPVGAEQAQQQGARREFKIKEARAMVEALVRSYYEVGLQQLLEVYDILCVEKEMSSIIVDNDELQVVLNGRADAIMREKATGVLTILSIKTAKDLDARASANWMEDDQGVSECYLLREMARNGLLEEWGIEAFDDVQVGVQMLYLLKGREYQDSADGIYKHNHPVVRPYVLESPTNVEIRPEREYQDEFSGQTKYLGKNWKRRNHWEVGVTQQDIIEGLLLNYPGAVEKYVQMPNLYIRTSEELDNWTMEAALQELNLATVRLDTQREENVNWDMLLAGEFPKYRQSCNYPVACDFKVLCHPVAGELGMSLVGEAMVTGGLVQVEGFKVRKANHPQEEAGDVQY